MPSRSRPRPLTSCGSRSWRRTAPGSSASWPGARSSRTASASRTRRPRCDRASPSTSCLRSRAAESAADRAHRTARLQETRVVDAVTGALARERAPDRRSDLLVLAALTDHGAQVGLVLREEAVAQLTVGREAHPVARSAEWRRHGRDDADRVRTAVDEPQLGGSRAAPGYLVELEHGAQPLQDLRLGHHGLAVPRVAGVERHLL